MRALPLAAVVAAAAPLAAGAVPGHAEAKVTTTWAAAARVTETLPAQPARLGSVAQPAFAATVTRYTDPPGPNCAPGDWAYGHHYQTIAPDSAPFGSYPNGLARFDKFSSGSGCPWGYYDPVTGSPAFTRSSHGDCRWDAGHAGYEVCIRDDSVTRYNVAAGTYMVLYTLPPGYHFSGGPAGSSMGWGGTAGVLNGRTAVTAADATGAPVLLFLDLTGTAAGSGKVYGGPVRLGSCAPTYAFVWPNGSGAAVNCYGEVLRSYTTAGSLLGSWSGQSPGHGEVASLAGGVPAYYGICKAGLPSNYHPCARNLLTGALADLAPGQESLDVSHVSTEWEGGIPAWVTVTVKGNSSDGRAIYHECIRVATGQGGASVGTIERWGQTYAVNSGGTSEHNYLGGEPHCVRSRGGGIWMRTDWGSATGEISEYLLH
jgi:hypothetical protein